MTCSAYLTERDSYFVFSGHCHCWFSSYLLPRFIFFACVRSAQIPGARSPWLLRFVRWRLISVGVRYGSCFVSFSWHLEFWGHSSVFRKFVPSWRMPCTSFVTLLNCPICNVGMFVSGGCYLPFAALFKTVKGGGCIRTDWWRHLNAELMLPP